VSASDWLHLLGFFFLFLAVLAGLYIYLPLPRRREPAAKAADGPRDLAEWMRLADEQEHYPPGHARRVADLAGRLADAIALPEALRPPLETACLLHDVGVVDHDAALLARPGFATQAELHQLWEHAARGARRAQEITGDAAVAQWVRWHHERWDGLGYPDGLAGASIPLPARILRLADSAESMLHPRPYRAALRGDEAIAEINRLAGVVYDPELARLFVDYVFPRYLAEQASTPS
jgi:HD-GYP domain-containing protein (c-di-GMP phosphodiesterase class II)